MQPAALAVGLKFTKTPPPSFDGLVNVVKLFIIAFSLRWLASVATTATDAGLTEDGSEREGGGPRGGQRE